MFFRCSELYPILDAEALKKRGLTIDRVACELRDAGLLLLQYRDKSGSPEDVLRAAEQISKIFSAMDAALIMNDRVDLAVLAGWGVHVGQSDLTPADARKVLGAGKVVGVSTHVDLQVEVADASEADYVAVGPVFATSTKLDAEPVIGLEGVRRARGLTRKPIVAIGGITRENARSVRDAGADSVALISGLYVPGESPGKVAGDFLRILR